jgi:hypothetical protein
LTSPPALFESAAKLEISRRASDAPQLGQATPTSAAEKLISRSNLV